MGKRFLLVLGLYLACLLPAQAGVPCSVPFTLSNGTLADANQVMANYNAIIACLGNAAASGSNSDITALNSLTTPITPSQGGTNVFIGAGSTGSANAQAVSSTTPNIFTLTEGYAVIFIPSFTNTSSMTFKVGTTATTNVVKMSSLATVPLTGGEIVAGQIAVLIYDGTNFVLSNSAAPTGGLGVNVSLAVTSGLADLGLVPSHSVNITGTSGNFGAITSFGSTASPAFPRYFVRFGASGTIVNNANTLIPGLAPGASLPVAAGDSLEVLYFGGGVWEIINYVRFTGAGSILNPTPLCGANGLAVVVGTGTSISYSSASIVLINGSLIGISFGNASGTINTTIGTSTSTPDGMDGGAIANGFGYVYFISDGNTVHGLVSSNSGTPNLPAGYSFSCRVGAVNFSSSSLIGTSQQGRKITYNSASPFVITGAAGDPVGGTSWASLNVSQFVPPTAVSSELMLVLGGTAIACPQGGPCGPAGVAAIAPNASFGGIGSDTGASANPPPMALTAGYTISAAGVSTQHTYGQAIQGSFLGAGPFAYAANGSVGANTGVRVYGWTDHVNAN